MLRRLDLERKRLDHSVERGICLMSGEFDMSAEDISAGDLQAQILDLLLRS